MIGEEMSEVSVVIPSFNYATYTAQAVESVLAQTFCDFEIIVVDDGSTDGTRDAMRNFGDKIYYIYKENGGVSSARNLGIKVAKGKYIAFLDCDDLWLSNKLEESLKGFMDEDVGLVYTNIFLIDFAGEIISENKCSGFSGYVSKRLLLSNFINNPTVIVKKECFSSVGFFDEKMFCAADWDMWLRISEHYQIKHIAETLSKYRIVRDYLVAHTEDYKKDSLAVIAKAYARNPLLPATLKKEAFYNIHLATMLGYYKNGRLIEVIKESWSLLLLNPIKLILLILRQLKNKSEHLLLRR